MLNAGRGNPNWISATPREAFFSFGHFAIEETRRVWNEHDLAGMPEKKGIAKRYTSYLENHSDIPGIELLKNLLNYGVFELGFDSDDWIYELTDGIIGDNYPLPSRILKHIEIVIRKYLVQELCSNNPVAGEFEIFATEGATAALCYVFDSLIANELLCDRDKIALMTPIFTPYLEIPFLPRYNFDVTEIKATQVTDDDMHSWQYPDSELTKLKDPTIKALFLVNPSNPPSVEIQPQSVKKMVEIVKEHNTNLMIITDDVYGTFVNGFRSIMADLPFNTISVYSFSKYFGVTGWRLGTIVLHQNNVFNKLLLDLPDNKKEELKKRYEGISTQPEEISFLNRIVADSRQVALNHTAGLSTPQQVQMAFFSLFALLDKNNEYKNLTQDICRRRQKLLFEGLELELRSDPYSAAYYVEFDLLEWAKHHYGKEFAEYLEKNYKPVDILLHLAEKSSIVLLNGGGFHGPVWSIRISLANLDDEYYLKIGKFLREVLEQYINSWKDSNKLKQ